MQPAREVGDRGADDVVAAADGEGLASEGRELDGIDS